MKSNTTPQRDLSAVKAALKRFEERGWTIEQKTGAIMMPVSKEMREAIQKPQPNKPDEDE